METIYVYMRHPDDGRDAITDTFSMVYYLKQGFVEEVRGTWEECSIRQLSYNPSNI